MSAGDGVTYFSIARDAPLATGPAPGWSGPGTLFSAPYIPLVEACDPRNGEPASFLVAGVPFDATTSSRPGASGGPRAIRDASIAYSAYLSSLGEHPMLDLRTGNSFHYKLRTVADVGDINVYPSDVGRTYASVAAGTRELARTGSTVILLGGDHSITFAAFAGISAALSDTGGARIAYVQIDHHFDFGRESVIHGAVYHGSNARRIAELPGMEPGRVAFVGVGAVTRADQFSGLCSDGFAVAVARDVRQRGVDAVVGPIVDALVDRVDAVYVSVDIDVLDAAYAPGTGGVTVGGLDPGELFDTVELLCRCLPVVCLDITEVAPRLDPSERTAHLAAQLLFDIVARFEHRR